LPKREDRKTFLDMVKALNDTLGFLDADTILGTIKDHIPPGDPNWTVDFLSEWQKLETSAACATMFRPAAVSTRWAETNDRPASPQALDGPLATYRGCAEVLAALTRRTRPPVAAPP
jgi:hypothetical protein